MIRNFDDFLILQNVVFPIFNSLPSLCRNVKFNNIDYVVHSSKNSLSLLQNSNYPLFIKIFKIGVSFFVNLSNHITVLNLIDQSVNLVGEMVVGKELKKLVLYFVEKLTYLHKLLDIFFVLLPSLRFILLATCCVSYSFNTLQRITTTWAWLFWLHFRR